MVGINNHPAKIIIPKAISSNKLGCNTVFIFFVIIAAYIKPFVIIGYINFGLIAGSFGSVCKVV